MIIRVVGRKFGDTLPPPPAKSTRGRVLFRFFFILRGKLQRATGVFKARRVTFLRPRACRSSSFRKQSVYITAANANPVHQNVYRYHSFAFGAFRARSDEIKGNDI